MIVAAGWLRLRLRWCVVVAAVAAVAAIGCGRRDEGPAPAPAPASTTDPPPDVVAVGGAVDDEMTTRPVPIRDRPGEATLVVITIDGARWQEVFEGADPTRTNKDIGDWVEAERLLPNIHRLALQRGVLIGGSTAPCGVVKQLGPSNVSLPGYLELFTARPTTCTSNNCVVVPTSIRTVFDDAAASGRTVASFSSWEPLAIAVTSAPTTIETSSPSTFLVSAGTKQWLGSPRPLAGSLLSWLTLNGSHVPPFPGASGSSYRPDPYTSAIALEYLRVNKPDVLHVGFGDSDEYAHANDYIGYLDGLRAADAFVGEVEAQFAAGTEPLTVVITSDHGRATNFRDHSASQLESARSFLIAFGANVERSGRVCLDHDVTLADVGATIRSLAGLPPPPPSPSAPSRKSVGVPIVEAVGMGSQPARSVSAQ